MKRSLRVAIMLLASSFLISCGNKVGKLDNTEKKFSYTIGQQIGQNLKAQGLKIDTKILAASIDEAVQGKESRLSPEEMQMVMQDMQKEMMEQREKEAVENLEKGASFLERNRAKDGVQVTDSGLQYRVITEGDGGARPGDNDMVEVHYVGKLINGEEFDSSYSRNQTAKFPVKGVIPGWTEGLQLMTVGSKFEFVIPAELAYGERGRPSIPPNSVLVFEVELIAIEKDN